MWFSAAPTSAPVEVHAKGTDLSVTFRHHTFHARFSGAKAEKQGFAPFDLDVVKLRGFVEKEGSAYVVVEAAGPSRSPKMAAHQCGAGTERAFVLFTISPRDELKKTDVVLVESCWHDLEPTTTDFVPKAGELLATWVTMKETNSAGSGIFIVWLSFDPAHPEHFVVDEEERR